MWIKTEALFIPDEIDEADWDNFTKEQKRERYHIGPFRFKADEIWSYNESAHGVVTIRFRNGESWMINKTLQELDKILGI